MFRLFLTAMFVFLSAPAMAGETREYLDNDKRLEGYLALPDKEEFSGRRPAVMIIHQWKGLGDYEKRRADMLADLGYVAFAVDMYGKGIRPASREEAAAESSKYKNDPDLARGRAMAALDYVRSLPRVDAEDIAAIGYCFGGTMALELARAGADIDAVVSFHGGLSTKDDADDDDVKASILVHHGAADPHVDEDEVEDFMEEMDDVNADWQFIAYAGAVHAFTEKEAGNDPSTGVAYDAKADKRSWAYTLEFFKQIF